MLQTESGKQADKALLVSLVIPVRDESAGLESLLDSINKQSLKPHEIIFVDGGSSDDTITKLMIYAKTDNRVCVIEAGPATPGRGRNIGISKAKYEWIALTDAGIKLEPDWLEKLVEVIGLDPQISAVYGNYEPVTNNFFERCAALAYVSPKLIQNGKGVRPPFIASSLIRKSVWEKVGGFPDLRAAEDLIFMRQIELDGFKTYRAPDALVWWKLRPNLSSTYRKFVLYSKNNVWAGMQKYWHYPLARQYAVWILFFVLAASHTWVWLVLPLVGYFSRIWKNIWIRREGRSLWWSLNPIQFAGVGAVLLTIDFATFAGWFQAIISPVTATTPPPLPPHFR